MMGFVVQLVALQALSMLAGLHYTLAVVLAVEAAIVHNFVWHERWTWRDRPAASRGARVDRLVRFNLASGAVSLAGNVVFTMVFVELAGLPVLVANVAGITCLTAINFFVADRLAFVPAGEKGNPGRLERRAAIAQTACCRPTAPVVATLCLLAGMGAHTHAAPLEAETVAAWQRYVAEVEGRVAREARATKGFLTADFAAPRAQEVLRASLGRGELPMEDVAGGAIDVGAGTISHWRGYVFVPGVTVDDLLDGVALAGPQTAHEQEDVLESRVLGRDGDSLRLFLKLQRKALVTVAYNTEHLVSYERRGSGRAISRSVSTRIAELENPGTLAEREKSAGQDRGFLWRLHSYWRYQAVPGGVIVELESLTLSRDVPWALRPVASPIIDRIARESMTRTLSALRARWSART
jgi:putative flippase GtrA